jgi:Mg2+/Co2+ transporter CorB
LNETSLTGLFSFLVVLILLSGFFSSSETGMMALNRYRLKHLKKVHRGARIAHKLLERPDRLIGLILIGNNLVNILASAIATVIAIELWGNAGIAVATVLLTLVILIFAEVTPKTWAALHPETVAFPAAYILRGLLWLFHPLVWLVNIITNNLLRLLGVNPVTGGVTALSSDELRTIVGEAGPHISQRHQGMLLNILDLEKVTVDDIMVPRGEIFGIDLEDDDREIIDRLTNSSYTRLVLYQEDINNVIGILHMRRVSKFLTSDGLDRNAMVELAREAYFVPEATPLNTQLLNFQNKKQRIAIVVDEYGAVQGLVTLEDLLEEIVGEFTSTLASEEDEIRPQPDGSYLIAGAATIRDINKTLDWDLPVDGPKTLNGLVLEQLESFPDAEASVQINDYYFEITDQRGTKIHTMKAKKRKTASEANIET